MTWRTIIPGVSSLFVADKLICSVVKEAPGAFRIETGDWQDSRTYSVASKAKTAAINHFKQAGIL